MLTSKDLVENDCREIYKTVTQASPSPLTALWRSWVSSFLLSNVSNCKATEKTQTALPMGLCKEGSWQADPWATARYPAWLLSHPPALSSAPGSCWLVHKETARCSLPAGLATCWLPITGLLLASRCFPHVLNALLSGRWNPFPLFTFLYISFPNVWLCFYI